MSALARHGAAARYRDRVGVADFGPRSRTRRFHVVDPVAGRITSYLVAHGRGSDPGHCGQLQRFSNQAGSNASSEGIFLTGDLYSGKHGRSMRLQGLDPTNSNAASRAIVIHGAWYVAPGMIATHGKLGRSEGCLAFDPTDLPIILDQLGPGRLIIAGRFQVTDNAGPA